MGKVTAIYSATSGLRYFRFLRFWKQRIHRRLKAQNKLKKRSVKITVKNTARILCQDKAGEGGVMAAATDDNAVLKYATDICFLALIQFFIFIVIYFIMVIRGVIFMNMNIISKYLQFLRKSNNYTQDDLAKNWAYQDRPYQNGKQGQRSPT